MRAARRRPAMASPTRTMNAPPAPEVHAAPMSDNLDDRVSINAGTPSFRADGALLSASERTQSHGACRIQARWRNSDRRTADVDARVTLSSHCSNASSSSLGTSPCANVGRRGRVHYRLDRVISVAHPPGALDGRLAGVLDDPDRTLIGLGVVLRAPVRERVSHCRCLHALGARYPAGRRSPATRPFKARRWLRFDDGRGDLLSDWRPEVHIDFRGLDADH